MKKIFLITYRNGQYRKVLEKAGYEVQELVSSSSDEILNRIKRSPVCDYTVVEIIDDSSSSFKLLEALSNRDGVICISNKISSRLKLKLLKNGISEFLLMPDPGKLLSYLKTIAFTDKYSFGKILIFDDDLSVKKILANIISRYKYEPIFADNMDDFFIKVSKEKYQLMLVNIGAKKIEMNSFVRRAHGCSEIKYSPLITYKDLHCGLYFHEMITGLNRFTKVILSLEELFGFLVDFMFRKIIIPKVDKLNKILNYDELDFYAYESLSQIYNSHTSDLLHLDNMLDEKGVFQMLEAVTAVRRSIVKSDGLRWLCRGKEDVATCGVGGLN